MNFNHNTNFNFRLENKNCTHKFFDVLQYKIQTSIIKLFLNLQLNVCKLNFRCILIVLFLFYMNLIKMLTIYNIYRIMFMLIVKFTIRF